jgi:hypothetical protein
MNTNTKITYTISIVLILCITPLDSIAQVKYKSINKFDSVNSPVDGRVSINTFASKYLIANIATTKGSKWQYFSEFEFKTKNKEAKKYSYTLVAKAKSMESTTYAWSWKFNSDGILRSKTLGDTLPEFKYVDAIGITDDGDLFINMNDKFKLLSPSQRIKSVKQLAEAYDRPQP